jgi:hypothetical protein
MQHFEAFLPMDNRNLILEPIRSRMAPHHVVKGIEELDLDKILAMHRSNYESDEDFVAATKNIYAHPLLAEVLSMPSHLPLKIKLDAMTIEDAENLHEQFKLLPCAEAMMVEFNEVLSFLTSSNTAPYLLGAGVACLAAMFYLVKYLDKEAGDPNVALSVLIDARDHVGKYGAPNGKNESASEFARRVFKRAVIKSDTEIAATQSASIVLGEKSFYSSETTTFVDNHAITNEFICEHALYVQRMTELHESYSIDGSETSKKENDVILGSMDESNCDNDSDDYIGGSSLSEKSNSDSDSGDDSTSNVKSKVPSKSQTAEKNGDIFDFNSDDEIEDTLCKPNALIYSVRDKDGSMSKVAVSFTEHYKFRGQLLQDLHYVQYCNMIAVVPKEKKSSRKLANKVHMNDDESSLMESEAHEENTSTRGRKTGKLFAFCDDHPLSNSFAQRIKEVITCGIRAGGPRPSFPRPLTEGTTPSAVWLTEERKAVEFYMANFIPWSVNDMPSEISSKKLRSWIQQQNEITLHPDKHSFRDRLCAQGVLQEFNNFAYQNKLDKTNMARGRQYRQRNRKMWTEKEKESYSSGLSAGKKINQGETAAKKLLALQKARRFEPQRLQSTLKNAMCIDKLMVELNSASPFTTSSSKISSHPQTNSALTALQQKLVRTHESPSPTTVNFACEKLNKKDGTDGTEDDENDDDDFDPLCVGYAAMRAARPPHYFSLEEANETCPKVPYYTELPSQEKFPCSLRPISLIQFNEEKLAWEIAHGENFKQDPMNTPKGPLNPEQREAARRYLLHVRSCSTLNRVEFEKEPETGTSIFMNSTKSCTGHLVTGAAGTGKSFMTEILTDIIDYENLGSFVSMSYTGVATLLMPNPRSTICTLFSIPGNCSKDLPPMTQQQISKFESSIIVYFFFIITHHFK